MIDNRAAIGEEEAEWTNVTGKVTGGESGWAGVSGWGGRRSEER